MRLDEIIWIVLIVCVVVGVVARWITIIKRRK